MFNLKKLLGLQQQKVTAQPQQVQPKQYMQPGQGAVPPNQAEVYPQPSNRLYKTNNNVANLNPGAEDGYDTVINARLNGRMQNASVPSYTLNKLGYGGSMNPGQHPMNSGYLGGGVPTTNGRIYEDANASKLFGPSGWINRL